MRGGRQGEGGEERGYGEGMRGRGCGKEDVESGRGEGNGKRGGGRWGRRIKDVGRGGEIRESVECAV